MQLLTEKGGYTSYVNLDSCYIASFMDTVGCVFHVQSHVPRLSAVFQPKSTTQIFPMNLEEFSKPFVKVNCFYFRFRIKQTKNLETHFKQN